MSSLPPIHRTISVLWDPAAAFRRFTEEFGARWPWRTHSIGGQRVRRVVFECRAGGLIFEEHVDGRRFQWGCVLEYDTPRSVKFTWNPSRDAATAQEGELSFVPEGQGTRVELISDKWENWGKNAARARRGYDLGWGYVLNVWAGRRTAKVASCACVDESDHNGPFEPVPQTVLDPFNGSGTTGAVAVMHGRQYIGIELNPNYIELSRKRIAGTQVKAAI